MKKLKHFKPTCLQVRKKSLSTVNEVVSAELEDSVRLHPGRPSEMYHVSKVTYIIRKATRRRFHRGRQRRQVLDVASNLQVSISDPIATQQHV